MSSENRDEYPNRNLEAKRRKNIEDNRRFLAALKINDIRDEIKHITIHTEPNDSETVTTSGRRAIKKEIQSDTIRRGSRVRKNVAQIDNLPPTEQKPGKKKTTTTTKKTDENQTHSVPKIKLQLPEHMLIRYQSTGKRVPLHNTKAKFGDGDSENLLM